MFEIGKRATLIHPQSGSAAVVVKRDEAQSAAPQATAVVLMNKAILGFELATIAALQLLVIVVIFVATIVLFTLAVEGLRTHAAQIKTVGGLLYLVQRSIAGVLVIVLGLEVLETLKAYFRDHFVRLEVILVVAIIAVSRHLVQIDFEHASPWGLIGLAAVVLCLTFGYFLVKMAMFAFPARRNGIGHEGNG